MVQILAYARAPNQNIFVIKKDSFFSKTKAHLPPWQLKQLI